MAESAIDGQTSAQAQQTGVPLLPSPSHRPKVVKADATARRTGRLGRLPKEFETSTAISVRSSLITAGGTFASDMCVCHVVPGHENTGRAHIVCDNFGKTRHTIHPEFFYIRHADRILRRCKSETETEIPPIRIHHVDLPLADLQEKMARPLSTELEELKDRLKRRYEHNDFIRHRWLVNRIVELSNSTAMLDSTTNASSKLEWLEQFLKLQCIEADEKVVVFTRWVRSQKMVLKVCRMLGLSSVSLNGQDSAEERQQAVRSFTRNGNVRVFVSTDAGGVGVNLQAARVLVNFEPAWNPSTDAQRIQRVHRIGQTRDVRAFLPMTCLDKLFTLSTHPRKSFAADRIDAARQATTGEAIQSWEELLPVIEYFRQEVEDVR